MRLILSTSLLSLTCLSLTSCLMFTPQERPRVETRIPATRPPATPPSPGDFPVTAPYRDWQYVLIHHSATASGCSKVFDAYHKSKGWRGVGYDFVINNGTCGKEDGEIEATWRWTGQEVGSHCKSGGNVMNKSAIGICLVGDFSKGRPSPKQMIQTVKLVKYLQATFKIPHNRVAGHSDVPGSSTECPGKYFPWNEFRRGLSPKHRQ